MKSKTGPKVGLSRTTSQETVYDRTHKDSDGATIQMPVIRKFRVHLDDKTFLKSLAGRMSKAGAKTELLSADDTDEEYSPFHRDRNYYTSHDPSLMAATWVGAPKLVKTAPIKGAPNRSSLRSSRSGSSSEDDSAANVCSKSTSSTEESRRSPRDGKQGASKGLPQKEKARQNNSNGKTIKEEFLESSPNVEAERNPAHKSRPVKARKKSTSANERQGETRDGGSDQNDADGAPTESPHKEKTWKGKSNSRKKRTGEFLENSRIVKAEANPTHKSRPVEARKKSASANERRGEKRDGGSGRTDATDMPILKGRTPLPESASTKPRALTGSPQKGKTWQDNSNSKKKGTGAFLENSRIVKAEPNSTHKSRPVEARKKSGNGRRGEVQDEGSYQTGATDMPISKRRKPLAGPASAKPREREPININLCSRQKNPRDGGIANAGKKLLVPKLQGFGANGSKDNSFAESDLDSNDESLAVDMKERSRSGRQSRPMHPTLTYLAQQRSTSTPPTKRPNAINGGRQSATDREASLVSARTAGKPVARGSGGFGEATSSDVKKSASTQTLEKGTDISSMSQLDTDERSHSSHRRKRKRRRHRRGSRYGSRKSADGACSRCGSTLQSVQKPANQAWQVAVSPWWIMLLLVILACFHMKLMVRTQELIDSHRYRAWYEL